MRLRLRATAVPDLPAEPGTTPIRDGYVRLYHQTNEANLKSIEKTGLLLEHAKGIEGPRAVYASETGFYGKPDKVPTLEFQVPKAMWSDPFVLQDVGVEDIIAAHYPWQFFARYIEGHPQVLEQTLAGRHDNLTGDEGRAVEWVKKKHGKQS